MRLAGLATFALVVVGAFALGRTTVSAPAAAAMQPAVVFSHFECYQAAFKGKYSGANVELTDQFQQYQTGIGQPELFCTPVTKKVISGPNLHVPRPADHLTCYSMQGPNPNQSRPFVNQFERGTVTVGQPIMLCLPTNKTG